MAEIASISSARPVAPSAAPPARVVPSLSQVAADQLQQSAQAFDAALVERNRTAAANAAAGCVYSPEGTVGGAPKPGSRLSASA